MSDDHWQVAHNKLRHDFEIVDVSIFASQDEILAVLKSRDADGWALIQSFRQMHASVESSGEFLRLIFARTVKAE